MARVINVIKESEMDQISTPSATVCLAQLLSRRIIAEGTPEEGAEGTDMPGEKEVDTVVEMRGSTHVGPFQTEILEGKISQAPTHDMHVMVTPIGCAELKQDQGTSATPWVTSAACVHDTHGWLQANINSGAEYD